MDSDAVDVPDLRSLVGNGELSQTNFDSVLIARVNGMLARWITSPKEFLTTLAKLDGIIGGEFALAFALGPYNFTPDRMDIVVPDHLGYAMVQYLSLSESYEISQVCMSNPYNVTH